MTIRRLWLTLAVALPVLGSLLATMSTVDLAYHLRAGEDILATGAIPTMDAWTFTANGEPWVDQQWGAQVMLRLIEIVGGWSGLAILRAVLIGFIFATLLSTVRRRGIEARIAAMLTLAAFAVALPALALRPQLLGLTCFALVLLLTTDRRAHPRRLWLVPVVVAIWANLHGSFFLGPLILGLAWLEDLHDDAPAPHRTLLAALVSALAACVTPFGPSVWVYAVGLSVNPEVTARITEWQPTSIRTVTGMMFFGSALAIVALIGRAGRIVPWPTLAWLAVFFVIGVYAERGVAWWPIAAAVAIAGPIIPARPDVARVEDSAMRRLNAGVVVALIVAVVVVLPTWRPIDPAVGAPQGLLSHAPSGITAALRKTVDPSDHIFNPQPWGSWFEYSIPHALYAIDSRIELFPVAIWEQYESVASGSDGWQEVLAAWGVDLVVLAKDQGQEVADRFAAADWTTVFEDAEGWVLRR